MTNNRDSYNLNQSPNQAYSEQDFTNNKDNYIQFEHKVQYKDQNQKFMRPRQNQSY